jgi:hypothetical protein
MNTEELAEERHMNGNGRENSFNELRRLLGQMEARI